MHRSVISYSVCNKQTLLSKSKIWRQSFSLPFQCACLLVAYITDPCVEGSLMKKKQRKMLQKNFYIIEPWCFFSLSVEFCWFFVMSSMTKRPELQGFMIFVTMTSIYNLVLHLQVRTWCSTSVFSSQSRKYFNKFYKTL